MGILHLHLLVMFSTFLSVRSCTNTTGGNRWSGRTIGGKLIFSKSNVVDLSNTAIVFKLPPVSDRKFHNKWTAGIIRFGRTGCNRRKVCPTDDTVPMVPCPGRGGVWCPADENDMTTTSATGTTPTETVTRTTLPTSTLDVTSTSPENDMNTTSGTTLTTTVTRTTPSTSTLDVTSTSPASNVTSTWHVQTGSRVREYSFVTVQYQIDRKRCERPQQCFLKLKGNITCNGEEEVFQKPLDDCNSTNVKRTFRGLQPYANYTVTLCVTCCDTGDKIHWISENITTAESVPTVAPDNITVTVKKSKYLMFKWDKPPCHGINGNIINYDFIFNKIRDGRENRIHNVTPRNFVIFNRIQNLDEIHFQVMANTKRGFGVYSNMLCRVFDMGRVSNCTNTV